MDYQALASELIRQLRGARSQMALSRHLGYRSNVVRTWEAGRRACKASALLVLCEKSKVESAVVLRSLYRDVPEILAGEKWTSPAFVSLLLDDLRARRSVQDISRKVGVNRYTVSRWLSGEVEPGLPDFLKMLDAVSIRMLDFVASIANPVELPSVAQAWTRLSVSRRLAVEVPWSHAVLRVLELSANQTDTTWVSGLIADRLGITLEQEVECLRLLEEAGQITHKNGRWTTLESQSMDTRSAGDSSRKLRTWAAQMGVDHIREGKDGLFSHNVFTVSSADLEKLKALHLDYFRQLRAIVAESAPAEHVVVANVQLFSLVDERNE